MLAKVVTITLLCTIAGAVDNVNSKKLSDAVLSYLEQQSSSSASIQVSGFNGPLNSALILDDKSSNPALLNKAAFFAKDVSAQATADSEKLRYSLEQLKIKLSPYSEEVTRLLSKTTEVLAITFTPYTQQLQGALEKITLQFVKELNSINLGLIGSPRVSALSMRVTLASYSQKLEGKMAECLTALRNAVAACTEKVKEKIDLQVLALYQSLSPLAEDEQDTLRIHMEKLNFLMTKSVILIESKIVEATAALEKQLALCISLLRDESSLFFSSVRKTMTLCVYNLSQKIKMLKDLVAPYREALAKSVVLHIENVADLLDASAAASLPDQKDLMEKKIFDKISDLLNITLQTTVTGTLTE